MDITIRHAEPDDYQALQELHAQPRAILGTLQLPFQSAELWRKRLAELPQAVYILVACVDAKVIASLGLKLHTQSPRRRHAAELGMAVHDRWQGQGVGTALLNAALDLADNWLDLNRLELNVFTDNEAAVKLYRSAGFEIEGTLQQYAFQAGRYADAYCMARLKAADR